MVEQTTCGSTNGTANLDFIAKEEKSAGLAQILRNKAIPDLRIVTGEGENALYSRDQSDIPAVLKDLMLDYVPNVVVQPSTADAVVSAIDIATEMDMPIIARGASSSPFGGAVPVRGGMVIDLSQMDRVLRYDAQGKWVKVQAGARWADIDHELNKYGARLRTSPSSKFSTVGGWIAGGGIGIGSLGYGHLSKNVHSVQLATAYGVRTLLPSEKEFSALFGSEGQMGVITEVTLAVNTIDPASRPHLIIGKDIEQTLMLANRLRYLSDRPEDLIYFSPGKMGYLDRLLGQQHFPQGHALLVTSGNAASEKAILDLLRELGLSEEKEYLARLMWHERYFPMKLRRLGPGMLGAEVYAPVERLAQVLEKAESLCREFALDPLLEVHFIEGPEALLLCYYLTDQGNDTAYLLDAVKSMIVTAALIELGSRPYSLGIWNNSFVDRLPEEEMRGLRLAKDRYDPDGLMNQGKYFRLSGRLGGIPSLLLTPDVAGDGLKMMAEFHRPLAPFLRVASKVARKGFAPTERDELAILADQCAMCGSCISVCPAFKVVHDERVTARGKMLTARSLLNGEKLTLEHAHRTFLCMRCKACEQVCQSKLHLIDAYDRLEDMLEKSYGKDSAEIEDFVRYTEKTQAYEDLVQRGLVLGAPRNGMGGENRV